MAKIAVTPTIVIAEFILFRKKVSFKKVHTKLSYLLLFLNEPNLDTKYEAASFNCFKHKSDAGTSIFFKFVKSQKDLIFDEYIIGIKTLCRSNIQ